MKVLMLSPLPPPYGGISTWTRETLDYFQNYSEDSVDVSVSCINTAVTGKRSKVISNDRYILDEIKRTVNILKQYREKIRKEHPDVIHINSSGAQFGMYRDSLMISIAKKNNIAVVLHFRCNVKDQAEYNRISRIGFQKLIKKARHILVLNNESYEYVAARTESSVEIIPNFTMMPVIEKPKVIRKKLTNVTFIGQVRKDKGISELLEAAKQLPEMTFHFYGNVYAEYENVNYPSNCIFHGNTDKEGIKEALDNSDVFVLPSYTEGFSNALVEAMARGIPCIASDVGANGEMLSGGCGICIPPKDIASLCKVLNSLKTQGLREKYSQNAASKCRKLYTRDRVCKTLSLKWSEAMAVKENNN